MVRLKQGDVIKVSFNPQQGHEQAGYRPAIIVSNKIMNDHTTVVYACPVTHTNRHSPFHIELKNYVFVDGFVMCEQMKCMDISARNCVKVGELNEADVIQIIDRIDMLIEKE